jgi:hypothetical protein
VSARGGRFTLALTIGSSCAWEAKSDVTWADVSPGSGQGSASLLLQVSESTRLDGRTLTLTINAQPFRVTQEGIICTYALSAGTMEVGDAGGQLSFVVTTQPGCTWTVTTNDSWITVQTPSGTGSNNVNVQIAPNTGGFRQGLVTAAGQRLTITQRAGN